MIKSAIRCYYSSKCKSMPKDDSVKSACKLFKCSRSFADDVYSEWRHDYVTNIISEM